MQLFSVFSLTFLIADKLKRKFNRERVIKNLNNLYLFVSIISIIGLFIYEKFIIELPSRESLNLYSKLPKYIIFIWGYFLISRCNEVFFAFLKDAFDKLNSINKSGLSYSHRIRLALKSYLELIFNFSILYLLLPKHYWTEIPKNIFESVYFSGVTITTLGYGDITPKHWFPQLLTIYEVFCGVILLVVCFAIYANKNSSVVSSNNGQTTNSNKSDNKIYSSYYIVFLAIAIILIRIIFPKIKFDYISLYLFLIAVIILIIPDLGDMIARIKKVKNGFFELEFSEKVSELNRQLEATENEIDLEEDNLEFDDEFEERAHKIIEKIDNPRGALVTLAVEIEEAVSELADYYNLSSKNKHYPSRKLVYELVDKGYLNSRVKRLFSNFWIIRNQAVHEKEFNLTEKQEYEVLDIGFRVLKLLSVKKQKGGER